MIFEQIRVGGDRNFAYLAGDEETRTAVVVDPAHNPVLVLERAVTHRLTIAYLVNTHGHPDHAGGNATILDAHRRATGSTPARPAPPTARACRWAGSRSPSSTRPGTRPTASACSSRSPDLPASSSPATRSSSARSAAPGTARMPAPSTTRSIRSSCRSPTRPRSGPDTTTASPPTRRSATSGGPIRSCCANRSRPSSN